MASKRIRSSLILSLLKYGGVLILVFGIGIVILAHIKRSIDNVFTTVITGGTGIWLGIAQAWIDENENGVWESNELALAGVQFSWYLERAPERIATETSGWNGEVTLINFFEDCDYQGQAIIQVKKYPSGLRLTTPDQVIALGTLECNFPRPPNSKGPFRFGFMYAPQVPTFTPYPMPQITSEAEE